MGTFFFFKLEKLLSINSPLCLRSDKYINAIFCSYRGDIVLDFLQGGQIHQSLCLVIWRILEVSFFFYHKQNFWYTITFLMTFLPYIFDLKQYLILSNFHLFWFIAFSLPIHRHCRYICLISSLWIFPFYFWSALGGNLLYYTLLHQGI